MDWDRRSGVALSRRRFLGLAGAAAGGSGLLLAGCDSSGEGSGAQAPGAAGDAEILNSARDLELMAFAAYALVNERLTGDALAAGTRFRAHEAAHAERLAAEVERLGGRVNRPRPDYGLTAPDDEAAALRFALELENRAVSSYLDALPRLSDPQLRATTASIVATQAQHLAVLRLHLGRMPVPAAFETGTL